MLSTNPGWTSERVELLRNLCGSGLSSREIALEIGVSRNAVIGKICRLKLNTGERRRPAAKDEPKARRPASQQSIMRALRTDATLADGMQIPDSHRCSLFELTNQTCRWPISST